MGDGIDPSTLITSDPTESTLILDGLNNGDKNYMIFI